MTHDAAFVAEQIGKTENWVKANAARLPHHRFGKTYVFTDDDIAEMLAGAKRRPDSPVTGGDELTPIRGRRRLREVSTSPK